LPAKFGGSADIVFSQEEPLWVARPLTRPGEFTPGIEGPACDREGNVYAVNYQRQGTIGRVTPEGAGEVFVELPEGSIGNGIRFDSKGNMMIADYTGHNVLKVDMTSKELTVYAHHEELNQPNELAIMDNDILFASDPNWKNSTGQIWRVGTDGKFVLLESDMGTTNGIEVSPDNKTLYVNESVQRNVWAYDLNEHGEISNKRLLIQFEDFGMDGHQVHTQKTNYACKSFSLLPQCMKFPRSRFSVTCSLPRFPLQEGFA
jgi:gluconolactonase